MTVTAAGIEKRIGKVIEQMGPDELAKYLHNENLAIGQEHSLYPEIDLSVREKEMDRIFDEVVCKLSWPDYAKFWKGMYKAEHQFMAKEWLWAVYRGLDKEEAYIALLLMGKYRNYPPENGLDPFVTLLIKRKHEVKQEIADLLKGTVWDDLDIERPDRTFTGSEFDRETEEKIIDERIEDLLQMMKSGKTDLPSPPRPRRRKVRNDDKPRRLHPGSHTG